LITDPTVFGSVMVHLGHADALVAGIEQHYPDALRPVLQIIGTEDKRAHSVHLMIVKDRVIFFADTTVNIAPNSEELAEIAISTAEVARRFHLEPRVAMLSFSNFGSARHESVERVRRAVEIVKRERPELTVDGEMQLDTAMTPELMARLFPFSALQTAANVLIFPDLQSANIGFKLLKQLGGAEAIGPILTGMRRPVHLVQHGCGVSDIVNLAAIATVEAHAPGRREPHHEGATDDDPVVHA
jgi:malate dehydrogenase (oxaloacetate-decarboxylating)(NADP+)